MGNGFCFYKIKATAYYSANNRDSFTYIDQAFCPKLGKQTKTNALVDFNQDFAWNFFNHIYSNLIANLNANLFKYLVNRNACKTGINQSLYLIAVDIVSSHISKT